MDQANYQISLELYIDCLDILQDITPVDVLDRPFDIGDLGDAYTKFYISEDDKNVILVLISCTEEEVNSIVSDLEYIKNHHQLNAISAELLASRVLDNEISEYAIKGTVRKPDGEIINYWQSL